MKVETIEIVLVCIIVSIQLYIFRQTYIQIEIYREIIPKVISFKISKIWIPIEDHEKKSPKEILANLSNYKSVPSDDVLIDNWNDSETKNPIESISLINGIERKEVNIIESELKNNQVLNNVLFSINNYLIRNSGASTDFNLIKDIVERNTSAVEEDINISIGLPLYLGLMGTMIGIVIGLFNMPDLGANLDMKAKDVMLNEGIGLLIGGVKIAMIASFSGLLLTILNSGWAFKGSRSLSESRKNDFYTFIQIELLPIINQGLASTLESLQRNLIRFKDDFTIQLTGLSNTVGKMEGVFDKSNEALEKQKYILDAIDRSKVSEMTRYNVKILQQLDISVAQFEKFNDYMINVNDFVENSQMLVNRTNELLARTDNFKVIANNLDNKLNQSQHLLEFLSAHFKKLEDHKEFTSNVVADVGSAISDTFKELKEHIQKSAEAMKNFTDDELELLKAALSASKTNLNNLEHLSTLNTEVSQFKTSSALQGEKLRKAIEMLNENMAKSIVILKEIERGSLSGKVKDISTSIKNVFRTKK